MGWKIHVILRQQKSKSIVSLYVFMCIYFHRSVYYLPSKYLLKTLVVMLVGIYEQEFFLNECGIHVHVCISLTSNNQVLLSIKTRSTF